MISNMWYGKEREGEFEGTWTLFVGSNRVPYLKIDDALMTHPQIKQIYFGAGGCTTINPYVVKECIKKHSDKMITIETTPDSLLFIDSEILAKAYIMLTINNKKFSKLKELKPNKTQIKLQSQSVGKPLLFIGSMSAFKEVNTKDLYNKMYEGDVPV